MSGLRLLFLPILVLAATTALHSQTAEDASFDFSALPLFWQTVDILEQDRMPTDAEWTVLFDHPGYRQIERQAQRGRVIRDVMPLVFMPSRQAARDSMLAGTHGEFSRQLHREWDRISCG
jgi:hypothetical protein